MTSPILGKDFILHVCEKLDMESLHVRRIVIDASYDNVIFVYIETLGDERMIEIDMPSGIVIKGVDDE